MLDIITEVTDAVGEKCSCSFVMEIIHMYEFSCRSGTSAVVFRAELKYYGYTEEYTASDFVEIISSWVENGASLVVDGSRLSVDPTCPTELESFEADDCVTQSPSGTTMTQPGGSNSSVVVIGGVAGALCFLLLVIIVVLSIAFIMRSKRKMAFSVRYANCLYLVSCRPVPGQYKTQQVHEVGL